MPHINVIYKPASCEDISLYEVGDQLIEGLASIFKENPDYVSLDFVKQSEYARNRKDIDLEVWSSAGEDGYRIPLVKAAAENLTEILKSYVDQKRPKSLLSVSCFVRVLEHDNYSVRY